MRLVLTAAARGVGSGRRGAGAECAGSRRTRTCRRAAALSRLLGGPGRQLSYQTCVLHRRTDLLACPSAYLQYSISSILSLSLLWAGEFFREKPVNTEKSQSMPGQFLAGAES